MGKDISIELRVPKKVDIGIELVYSGKSIDVDLIKPQSKIIEVSFANIGPRGPSGAGGAGSIITMVANENIPAFLAVTGNGLVANSNIISHRNKIVGLALANINNGFSGLVQTGGSVENNSWTWLPGDKIFLNGTALSTIPPSTGFIVQIGVAPASNAINIEIQPSILL